MRVEVLLTAKALASSHACLNLFARPPVRVNPFPFFP